MPNNNPAIKAKLRMPDYSGSWWSRREDFPTTLRIGKWTPVACLDIPGNSLQKFKPSIRLESLPMLSPLYNGYTIRTKFYFAPYRLYIPELRKNLQQDWGTIPNLPIPKLTTVFNGDLFSHDDYQFSFSGSLLDRLNMAYGDIKTGISFDMPYYMAPVNSVNYSNTQSINMLPLLAYIDAWLYGEFNPQDKNIPVDIDDMYFSGFNSIDFTRQYGISWVNSDDLYKFVSAFAYGDLLNSNSYSVVSSNIGLKSNGVPELKFDVSSLNRYQLVPNYPLFTCLHPDIDEVGASTDAYLFDGWKYLRNSVSGVGLLPVTYKGDYLSSWFSSEGIAKAQQYLVQINQSLISLRKKNSDMLVSLMSSVSGNRYVDYLQYIFDSNLELKDHPIMVGFDELHLGAMDVLSQSDNSDGQGLKGSTAILGGTAGKVRDYNSTVKPISFKTKEPGLLLVCTAIVPNVVYATGRPRFMNYETFADFWHPQYQKMGFDQTERNEYFRLGAVGRGSISQGSSTAVADNLFRINTGNSITSFTPIQYNILNMDNIAISYVPLGWEHMASVSRVSGALKTDAYRTWTLRRTFDDIFVKEFTGYDSELSSQRMFQFNPITNTYVNNVKSTYVDGSIYNYPFANVSRADGENFIFQMSLERSMYQPLVHTLISKTI